MQSWRFCHSPLFFLSSLIVSTCSKTLLIFLHLYFLHLSSFLPFLLHILLLHLPLFIFILSIFLTISSSSPSLPYPPPPHPCSISPSSQSFTSLPPYLPPSPSFSDRFSGCRSGFHKLSISVSVISALLKDQTLVISVPGVACSFIPSRWPWIRGFMFGREDRFIHCQGPHSYIQSKFNFFWWCPIMPWLTSF